MITRFYSFVALCKISKRYVFVVDANKQNARNSQKLVKPSQVSLIFVKFLSILSQQLHKSAIKFPTRNCRTLLMEIYFETSFEKNFSRDL